MRRILFLLLVVLVGFQSSAFAQNATADEQNPTDLTLSSAAICRDVVDRQPVEPGNVFPATIGTLFCYTHVLGALPPTEITHVWYYQDQEMGRVDLRVGSPNWRTFSSKRILQVWTGSWHVDILGPEEELLRRLSFVIEPQ